MPLFSFFLVTGHGVRVLHRVLTWREKRGEELYVTHFIQAHEGIKIDVKLDYTMSD